MTEAPILIPEEEAMADMQITEAVRRRNYSEKGMSKAAKGTIIGTVGGAAVGAIVAKKTEVLVR